MPDMERFSRYAMIEILDEQDPTGVETRVMKSYYKGIDKARTQIAILFGVCVGIGSIIYILST